MATADVTMWSAAITGLDPTATDIEAEGWTKLSGTEYTGQSSTHALVIDNGLVRLVIDRNATTDAVRVLLFDGTAWSTHLSTNQIANPTVTDVLANGAHLGHVRFVATANAQPANEVYHEIRIHAGRPALSLLIEGETDGFDFLHTTNTNVTFLEYGPVSGVRAIDSLGPGASLSSFTIDRQWVVSRRLDEDVEIVFTKHEDTSWILLASSSNQGVDIFDPNTPPTWYDIGFIIRSYGLGDGGGADQGNGDGHVREGEDNVTAVTGTWAKATGVSNASNSAVVRNSAPSANDEVSWSMNVPQAGDYYIALRCVGVGSGGFLEVGVNGVDSGTPQAIPTTALGSQTTSLVFGPYTGVAGGNRTVDARISTLGSLTSLDIDHLEMWAFQASTGTVPFPKNLADSLLWRLRLVG